MAVRFAFAGFRHNHIMGLYDWADKSADVEIVAACEEHPETREKLAAAGKVRITHDSLDAMLDKVECDVVAVADYYGRRGQIERASCRERVSSVV